MESRNFGWSWGVEGGDDGGDGVGWWSLIGGPDRPSETVSPEQGGEALEPEQMMVVTVLGFHNKLTQSKQPV